MPAWIICSRIAGDSEAGPIVATILVLCDGNFMPVIPPLKGSCSQVVALGGAPQRSRRSFLAPPPTEDEGMILAALVDVLAMVNESVADGLLGIRGARTELRQPVDHIL